MLVRVAEIVYGDGCCAVGGSENQTLLGHHDNEPFALVSESTGDYMWSASCTEGIWQGVCVLSIVKAPLAKVEDILPDVFIILQAFPSGCGTHSSYLCNIAHCKMITDVV